MHRVYTLGLLASLASGAQAQDTAAGPAAKDATSTVDLETVRVVERRPEWIDPFGFRSSFDPDDNMFNRHWNEPPSVENISLQGGYLLQGINHGLMKAAQAVTRLPGFKHQVKPAIARPPPLDETQLQRALRVQAEDAP